MTLYDHWIGHDRQVFEIERISAECACLASPGRAILDVAKGADLIVVGSRQQSAAGRLFLGSTSLQITHHAECPVVVVPPADQTSSGV